MLKKVAHSLQLFNQAFANLRANDPIRMAGATAFFSFFALPPIVIILSNVLSTIFNDRYQRVSGQLFDKLADLFGPQSANQLEDISEHLQNRKSTFLLTVASVFLLLLASTTLFAIIKNSLNQLWNVKAKSNRRFYHTLTDKAVASTIILFSGMLFIVSLSLEQVMGQLGNRLALIPSGYHAWVISGRHYMMSIVTLTLWFAIVFKYLPDIRIRWKAVWRGAIVTSLLFKAGEAILDRLLINSPVSSLYGASGAIILILLFVFYSSLIFYFGAAFTRQYAQWIHLEAEPAPNAVGYKITEVTDET